MSEANLREIIFDTETTGLKPEDGERIIEIGAVELINRFPTGKNFHVYLNPQGREVHPEALKVHGITNEYLNDKPTFEDVMEDFLAFFSQGHLIAHNAKFDMGFINAELKRFNQPPIGNDRVVDTLEIARRKHPMGPNSLDALCSRYGIDNSRRDKHGALLDSELLAEVYIELLGGRQASLILDDSDDNASSIQENGVAGYAAKQRPNPLPPRLDAQALKKHEEFIESLGDNAMWKKLASWTGQ